MSKVRLNGQMGLQWTSENLTRVNQTGVQVKTVAGGEVAGMIIRAVEEVENSCAKSKRFLHNT